ncbi:MAG: hypothetical protein E6J45_13395 [Chloroflexi bacterium]|nr:MAG: hypothetical protein E6J45_13395 [Chloroflexota bacterium]
MLERHTLLAVQRAFMLLPPAIMCLPSSDCRTERHHERHGGRTLLRDSGASYTTTTDLTTFDMPKNPGSIGRISASAPPTLWINE